MIPKSIPRPFLSFTLLSLLCTCIYSPRAIARDAGQESARILKWGTIAPVGTSWQESIERVNRLIEEGTNGNLKNVWYYGAVMGDEVDVIRKVKLGQLQGTALLTLGLQKIAPEVGVFTLPFLFRDFEEVDCVFPKVWHLVEDAFERHGFVVLGYTDVCFAILQSRITPEDEKKLLGGIKGNRIEDWELGEKLLGHLKQWAWIGLDIDRHFYGVVGVENIIPLPLTDVLTALQTGMVNSVYGSCTTTVALQWQIHINKIVNFEGYKGVAYAPAMMVVDRKTFYSLPDEYQKIIRRAWQTEIGPGSDKLTKILRADEEKMCQGLRKRGVKEYIISSSIVEKYKGKSMKLREELVGKFYPPEFLAAVIKARDECCASMR